MTEKRFWIARLSGKFVSLHVLFFDEMEKYRNVCFIVFVKMAFSGYFVDFCIIW